MNNQSINFTVSADGVRLASATTGKGSQLVSTPAWFTHLDLDRQSPVWNHQINELSSRHQLIRYDQRGCGLSHRNIFKISFEAWMQDLEAVVKDRVDGKFPLIGVSNGAALAIAYAARNPSRVSHLIIHGGFARGCFRRGLSQNGEKEAETIIQMAEFGWDYTNPAFRQFFSTQMIPSGTEEQLHWMNGLAKASTSGEIAAQSLRALSQVDVTECLSRIKCPTIVFHSLRDGHVPFSEGRIIASSIPGARFVPLDSNNHLILEQDPAWKQYNEEISEFLPCLASSSDVLQFGLNRRESQVLELIARGCDNSQVAAHLGLEVKTVRNYITSVFSKIQVENRPQAIILARNKGMGLMQRSMTNRLTN